MPFWRHLFVFVLSVLVIPLGPPPAKVVLGYPVLELLDPSQDAYFDGSLFGRTPSRFWGSPFGACEASTWYLPNPLLAFDPSLSLRY